MNVDSTINIMDIIDILLNIKDSQISNLNNLMAWGIAISTIFVTLTSLGWGWALKKVNDSRRELNEQLSVSRNLIQSLEYSNSEILQAQTDIELILKSDDFKYKLNKFEENINEMEDSVRKWEEFYQSYKDKMFTIERYRLLTSFSDYMRLLSHDTFKVRFNTDENNRMLEMIGLEDNKEQLTNEELINLINELTLLFDKYKKDDDDYGYMV